MFDFMPTLIASALAQTTDAAPSAPVALPGGSGTSVLVNFVPLVLIFGVFYMLIIRPQQKKLDEQNKMVKALKRGDRVVTTGGVHGKITRLEGEDALMIEIADGVNIKIERTHVTALVSKTEPASTVPANDGAETK